MRPFRTPTRVFIEPGALTQLPDCLRDSALPPDATVLLVLDSGLAATPWAEKATQLISSAGFRCLRFEGVENNPRAPTVESLADLARSNQARAVVGLGGGSVLDAAKAAAMLVTNGGHCEDYEGAGRFSEAPLPFIAVPSTCGTGSEVTWVSVLTVQERRTKISVKGDGMFPAYALVDADLLATLPSHLVAWTGLDALTHALEASTVKLANPTSDALATRAIELLFRFLPRAARDISGDAEARREVMTASTLAGMAFGNADVGAVHCLSETLGGLWDVHHGLANAILLAPVLRSHGAAVEAPLARLSTLVPDELVPDGLVPADSAPASSSSALGHLEDSPSDRAERFLTALDSLVRELDVPSFSSLGIAREGFQEIAARAVSNGSNSSNPRSMGEAEYLEILKDLA